MRRRDFIAALGGAAATWPLAARAQQSDRMPRIGVLIAYAKDDPEVDMRLAAFRAGLAKRGWAEGRNVQIDYRFAAGSSDQYPAFAKELIALRPDVILAHTTPVTAALRQETHTVPIVFVNVSDPIGSGFIANLARPGGNITGVLHYEPGIVGKWLGLPQRDRAQPRADRPPGESKDYTSIDYFLRSAEAAAASLSVEVIPYRVENQCGAHRTYRRRFSVVTEQRTSSWHRTPQPSFHRRIRSIALAAHHRLSGQSIHFIFFCGGGRPALLRDRSK